MDIFEQFYPSEVARLVLGYLNDINCLYAWEIFLVECSDLQEHYTHYNQGKKHSTTVNGKSLQDILSEYCKIKYKIASEQIGPSQVHPAVSNEESAEKNIEKENTEATSLPSVTTPSYVGIIVPKKGNLTTTSLDENLAEVRSENASAASTEKDSSVHDSTKISGEVDSVHINPETSNSDSAISFKRPAQCRKRKSLPKKKHCCHKITQTDVLSSRDTDVQTELQLLYTSFREYVTVGTVREDNVVKSADCQEFKMPDPDSQAAFTSDGVEDNCIVAPLKKRKGFIPRRLITHFVHDAVETQAETNKKEILKDMVILEEFLSYQPFVKSICDNINGAIGEELVATSLTSCFPYQKVAKEKIIKKALNKTKIDPFLQSYLSFYYCRKDFQFGKLKKVSAVHTIGTDNKMNISMEYDNTETHSDYDTSLMKVPHIDSCNMCLEKEADIEFDVNRKTKQTLQNLEKICTSDLDFDEKSNSASDCWNTNMDSDREKATSLNAFANTNSILSKQNIVPTNLVNPLKYTSPFNLTTLDEKSSNLDSSMSIQTTAPVNSVVSIETTAPIVSVMPIQSTAASDSISRFSNFKEQPIKPIPIGIPFTSEIIPSTNQSISQLSNLFNDSVFLPTNQNLCASNVFVSNASNNISNLVFPPFPNNNIFTPTNPLSSPQFPYSGLSSLFVPNDPFNALPMQNNIQYSLIINPNISWNCSPSNDVKIHGQTVIKDLQNEHANSNSAGLGLEEEKSVVEDQPEDDRTINDIALKKVASVKKKSFKATKNCTASIKKRKLVTQKKTIPIITYNKAVEIVPSVQKFTQQFQSKKLRRLLPLPTATTREEATETNDLHLFSTASNTPVSFNESADTGCEIDNLYTQIEVADTQISPLKSLLSSASMLAAMDAKTNPVVTRSLDFVSNVENNENPVSKDFDLESSSTCNTMSSSSVKSNKIAHQVPTKPISDNKVAKKSKRKKVAKKVGDITRPEKIACVSSKLVLDKDISKHVSIEPKKKKTKKDNVDAHNNDNSKPHSSITKMESNDYQLNLPTTMAVTVLNAMQNAIDMQSSRASKCSKQNISNMKLEIFDISNVGNEDVISVGNFVSNSNIVLEPKVERNEAIDLNHVNSTLPISNEAQDPASDNETLDSICAFLKAEDFENSQLISSSNSGLGSNTFAGKPGSSAPASTPVAREPVANIHETEICLSLEKNIPKQNSLNFIESLNNCKGQVNATKMIKRNSSGKVKVMPKNAAQDTKKKEPECQKTSKRKVISSEPIVNVLKSKEQSTVLENAAQDTKKKKPECQKISKRKVISSEPIVNVLKSKEQSTVLENAAQDTKKKNPECQKTSKRKVISSEPIVKVLKSKEQSTVLEKLSVVENINKSSITHKYPLRTHSHKNNNQDDSQYDPKSNKIKKQVLEDSNVEKSFGLIHKMEEESCKQQTHSEETLVSSPELFIDEIGAYQETENKDAIEYESSDQTITINRQVLLDHETDDQLFLKKLTVTIERMDSEMITKAMFPNQVINVDVGNLHFINSDVKSNSKSIKNKDHCSIINKKKSAPAKKQRFLSTMLPKLESNLKTIPGNVQSENECDLLLIKNKLGESVTCSLKENPIKKLDLVSPLKKPKAMQLEEAIVIQLDSSDTMKSDDVPIKNKPEESMACSFNENSIKSDLISPIKKNFSAIQLEQEKIIHLGSSDKIETGNVPIKNKHEKSIVCILNDKSMKSDPSSPLKEFPVIHLEEDVIPSSLIATNEYLTRNKSILANSHNTVLDNVKTLLDISSVEQRLNSKELVEQKIEEQNVSTWFAEETKLDLDIVPSISDEMVIVLDDSYEKAETDLTKTCMSSKEHAEDKGQEVHQIEEKSTKEMQHILSREDTASVVENQQCLSAVSIEKEILKSSPALCKKRKLYKDFTDSQEYTIDRQSSNDEKAISCSSRTPSNEPDKTFPKSILKRNPGRHFSIPSCVKSYEEWKAEKSPFKKIRRSRPTLKIVGFLTPEKEATTSPVSNAKASNSKLNKMTTSTGISEISSILNSKLCNFQKNDQTYESQQGLHNPKNPFKKRNNISVKDLSTNENNLNSISSEEVINLEDKKASGLKHLKLLPQSECYPKNVNTDITPLSKKAFKKDTKKEIPVPFEIISIQDNNESEPYQTDSHDKLNQDSDDGLLKEMPPTNVGIPSTINEKDSTELLKLEKCSEHKSKNRNSLTIPNMIATNENSNLKNITLEEVLPLNNEVDILSAEKTSSDVKILPSDLNTITEDCAVLPVSSNDVKTVFCDNNLDVRNSKLGSPNVSTETEENVPLAVSDNPKTADTQTENQSANIPKRNKINLNSSKCNSEELLSALSAEMVKSIKGVKPEVLLEQMREYGLENLLNLLSEKE